jgi:LAO/AO transport system kinase
MKRNRLPAPAYAEGILAGDRLMLSRAITLAESTRADDAELASQVVDLVLPQTGNAVRLGITGVPGVGKSSFIEAFGTYLTEEVGKSLAVLAIDPTSRRSRGSILGDKTRMEKLSMNPNAYIRPTAAGSTLGGTAAHTREAMLLCEAAGFSIIFIETVGVGQSEIGVRDMVDFFLLLMLAGAGDELQGIKRGIMEMADGLVITKADGPNAEAAERAKAEYQNAMHLFPATESGWIPEAKTCSAMQKQGLAEIWDMLERYNKLVQHNGYLAQLRQEQELSWFRTTVSQLLEQNFYQDLSIKTELPKIQELVQNKELSAVAAARKLFKAYKN